MSNTKRHKGRSTDTGMRRQRWWLAGGILIAIVIGLGVTAFINAMPRSYDPPEAAKVLAAQKDLSFPILIPAYLPKGFDRSAVELQTIDSGPSAPTSVQLTYRGNSGNRRGVGINIREWTTNDPDGEILSGARPIETRWGKGWLLTQGGNLSVLWVDVGHLRVEIGTNKHDVVTAQDLLQAANTLGLATATKVYSFVSAPAAINGVEPAPLKVALNDKGVQEVNLTVTPGGYSPIRFSVKKGMPVKINFRQLGEVGCGNDLLLPLDPTSPSSLHLKSPSDMQVLEFTPQNTGEYGFHCSLDHFRGVMTVTEGDRN